MKSLLPLVQAATLNQGPFVAKISRQEVQKSKVGDRPILEMRLWVYIVDHKREKRGCFACVYVIIRVFWAKWDIRAVYQ